MKLAHFANPKCDLPTEMGGIASFLDIEIDEARWPLILDYCSFDSMKANAIKTDPLEVAFWDRVAEVFINKDINDRRNDILTAAESAHYQQIAETGLGAFTRSLVIHIRRSKECPSRMPVPAS